MAYPGSMELSDPRPLLQEALQRSGSDDHVELRYHATRTRSVAVEKGRVDQARAAEHTGVGVRVLAGGRIVQTGGPELALRLEEEGYDAVMTDA